MTEIGEVGVRKRRSRQEIKRLVREFETSGLRRSEFCHKAIEAARIDALPKSPLAKACRASLSGLVWRLVFITTPQPRPHQLLSGHRDLHCGLRPVRVSEGGQPSWDA